MCGIVGLFLKDKTLEPKLGAMLSDMLVIMTDRGPDSAGIAIYGAPSHGRAKITVQSAKPAVDFAGLEALLKPVDASVTVELKSTHAVIETDATQSAAVRNLLAEQRPDVRVMGSGDSVEIYKEVGLPKDVVARFGIREMGGTHGIGHTRMATESAVTTEHSHPFTPAPDMCLVHNGSLSNHNNLRKWLRKQGQEFETDNDSEVAARYFAYRLAEGASLKEAMEAGLTDLDGFFTFTMGTKDGFAVLRDAIACKPAVLAENDDWVAMASEFRSLAYLPNIEKAKIWEPAPATVYTWSLH